MDCVRCGSKHYIKDGVIGGKQRYCCKRCDYRYRVSCVGYTKEVRYYALKMVSDGDSFRQVARTLEISEGTVRNWVRKHGEEAARAFRKHINRKAKRPRDIVEIDELCTFIGAKKIGSGYGRRDAAGS